MIYSRFERGTFASESVYFATIPITPETILVSYALLANDGV